MSRGRASAVALAVVMVLSIVAGASAPAAGAPDPLGNDTPSGYTGLPDTNIESNVPQHAQDRISLSAADLEGSTMTDRGARTLEVSITTEAAARGRSAACSAPAGEHTPAMCNEVALNITDDADSNGRRVALPKAALTDALGFTPGLATVRHESGDVYEVPVKESGRFLVFNVEHFSTNTVTFSGEVSITGSPAADGTSYTYDVNDLDAVDNFNINVTGAETSHNETIHGENVGPSSSQSVSIGGNKDPVGQSTTDPQVTVEGPWTSLDSSTSSTSLDGARHIAFAGNYAIVTGYYYDGISVVDVSDPQNPSVVGSVSDASVMDGAVRVDIGQNGDYAYVTGINTDSVAVVDITTPSSPTVAGSITNSTELDAPSGIEVDGNYAYVTSTLGNQLTVLDISTATSPSIAATLTDASISDPNGVGLNKSSSTLYIANTGSDALTIVDVSTPSSPSVLGSVTDSTAMNGPRDVVLGPNGDYAFLTGETSDTVASVDVTNSTSPAVADYVTDSTALNRSWGISQMSGKVYVGAPGTDRISVLDVSSPTTISVIDSMAPTGYSFPMFAATNASDSFVYSTSRDSDTFGSIAEPERVSSLSVSDGQGNSVSFGDVPIGTTTSKTMTIFDNATSLSWSGSGGVFDYDVELTERTISEDIAIEVNGNYTRYNGTLSSGTTSSLTTNTSWINNGTNRVNVTVDEYNKLTGDAPTPSVDLDYRHGATDNLSTDYTAEKWSERYNVSKSYASDRSKASLEVPFVSSSVIEVRSVEYRINESGGWSAAGSSHYSLAGTTLTVDLDALYGSEIPAGTTMEVRTAGSKVSVYNGSIKVLEATVAGGDLNSKIEYTSVNSDTYIDVSGTADSEKTHYLTSTSWSGSPYAEMTSDGSQHIYAPGAGSGSTANVRTLPLTVAPDDGGVEVVVNNPDTPRFRIRQGDASGASSVKIGWNNTVSGSTYALVNADTGKEVLRDTAESPVYFTIGDSDTVYYIEQVSGSTGVVASETSATQDPLGLIAVFAGILVSMLAFVYAGRRFLGATTLRSNALLVVGGSVVGIVGIEAVTSGSVIGQISVIVASTVPDLLPSAPTGTGTILVSIVVVISLFLIDVRLIGLPRWLYLAAGIPLAVWVIDTITAGALSGGLEEISAFVWMVILLGGVALLWRALQPTIVKIGGNK